MENDIKTNINELSVNENNEMIEIHSKDIIEKDKREKYIKEIVISSLIFLITFGIPIILIIVYGLYDYIVPFFKTYIFIIIRQFWLVAIATILFFPFKVYEFLKKWVIEIGILVIYVSNPLKNSKVKKEYNGIKYNKVKQVYYHWCRFWFLVKLIIYLIVFIMLLFVILLICFMLGHMISWMDYFWILR